VPIIELWQRVVPLIVTTGVANLPASQLVQMVDPAVDWYLPASQLLQFVAPANEYVPAPQLVQDAELVCDVKPENLPA
jgi:hypothetical protein